MLCDPQSSKNLLAFTYVRKSGGTAALFWRAKIVLRSDSANCQGVLRRAHPECTIKNEARPYYTMPLICTMRMNAHEIGDAIKLL